MIFEERGLIALGSMGDLDACIDDHLQITNQVDRWNAEGVNVLCHCDLFRTVADVTERLGHDALSRMLPLTSGRFPYLRVKLVIRESALLVPSVPEVLHRLRLQPIWSGRGKDHRGSLFGQAHQPTLNGLANHPQIQAALARARRLVQAVTYPAHADR